MKRQPGFETVLKDALRTLNNPRENRKRVKANAKLILILAQYLTEYPQQRFGQALRNLEIVRTYDTQDGVRWLNEFNTEPTEMLQRVKKALKEIS